MKPQVEKQRYESLILQIVLYGSEGSIVDAEHVGSFIGRTCASTMNRVTLRHTEPHHMHHTEEL